MECLSPLKIRNKNFSESVKIGEYLYNIVPCGKCFACMSRKREEWSLRLEEELKSAFSAYFVTLTYDDDHLPFNDSGVPSVSKRDIQLFMKRLRKSCPDKIRYFLTAEYGPNTHRPHYHGIFLNLPKLSEVDKFLLESWQNGFVSVGRVTSASISYCAKYCISKSDVPDLADPVFMLCSKGLGVEYVDTMKDFHSDIDNMFAPYAGRKTALPRYYRTKLYSDSQLSAYRSRLQDEHLRKEEELIDPLKDNQKRSYYNSIMRLRIEKSSKL